MRRALLAVSLLSSGCFWRAQAGYALAVPPVGPGGGALEVSAGAGDVRSEPSSVLVPQLASIDVAGHLSTSGQRLGLGASATWAPLAGWRHDWSPTLRLGARVLQVEWLPALRPTASLSGLAELGVLFFPSHATRGRVTFGLSLAGEVFVRYGIGAPPGVSLFGLVSFGYGTSLGPTS